MLCFISGKISFVACAVILFGGLLYAPVTVAACPTVYDPVCTFNGVCFRTFGNKCEAGSQNSNLPAGRKTYNIIANGACEDQPYFFPLCRNNCPTACILLYAPLCATNGFCTKTFSNRCALGVFNCQNDENFLLTHQGECYPYEFSPCQF